MMENYLMMKVLNLYLNNSMLSEDAKSQINQGQDKQTFGTTTRSGAGTTSTFKKTFQKSKKNQGGARKRQNLNTGKKPLKIAFHFT